METKFIEATQGQNWGKFCLGRFTKEEWDRTACPPHGQWNGSETKTSLLRQRGWSTDHILVLDIETGEGAFFRPGGFAVADLNKHKIWVCPMFEPFLGWLYQQDLSDLNKLPGLVEIPDVPFEMRGYRRPGTTFEDFRDSLSVHTKVILVRLKITDWPHLLNLTRDQFLNLTGHANTTTMEVESKLEELNMKFRLE